MRTVRAELIRLLVDFRRLASHRGSGESAAALWKVNDGAELRGGEKKTEKQIHRYI